jgi:hypothetical protein
MTMPIPQSSVPSHGIDASKNNFHSRIDFSQGIDSVESMPGDPLKFINSYSGFSFQLFLSRCLVPSQLTGYFFQNTKDVSKPFFPFPLPHSTLYDLSANLFSP